MTKPKHYLFKRRRYGWGWTPVSWRGWVIVVVPVAVIIANAFLLPRSDSVGLYLAYYLSTTFLVVTLLILVVAKNSPKPKWRWGKKDTDNPDEDF